MFTIRVSKITASNLEHWFQLAILPCSIVVLQLSLNLIIAAVTYYYQIIRFFARKNSYSLVLCQPVLH